MPDPQKNAVSTPQNEAAWVRSRFGGLRPGPAPYTDPGPHEIVVRNRAVSINPVDIAPAPARSIILPWLRYPAVLGSDVAGEVTAVGSAVTRFHAGDRVLGHALGVEKSQNRAAEGAFQRYTILQEHMASAIPADLAFEDAATLPLTLSTAACGLFEDHLLRLRLPGLHTPSSGDREAVVVWGASTNVGGNAVQLASNAGYDVIAVAGAQAADRLRDLGVREVVDRRNLDAVANVVRLLHGRLLAGILAIGSGSTAAGVQIAQQTEGGRRVAAASVGPATSLLRRRARRTGVTVNSIWGSALKDNRVGPAIYADYLPGALLDGTHRPPNMPHVVGEGIGAIRAGFDALRQGANSTKVVVRV